MAFSQRAGDFEVGGSIMFRGESESGTAGSTNRIFVRPRLGFYVSRSTEIEVDATVNFNFTVKESLTDNETTINLLHYIAAMEGSDSKLYLMIGGGLWSYSESEGGQRAKTSGNGIVTFGGGSKTFIGRKAFIRAELQFRYLFPDGTLYTNKRKIFQANLGVGLLL